MMNKYANLIIIGGTIAAGKSTLVDNIAKATGWNTVPELRDGDRVQEVILEKLYEGTRLHLATVQYYFISNRYKQYKESSSQLITSILDRGLWEDWFFAKLLMVKEPRSYEHYKPFWRTTIKKILELYGKPKAYIFTTIDWDTFKSRIFARNRQAEIKNFSNNETYFKNLLNEYNDNFVNLLKEWDIQPIVIDSISLTEDEVAKIALAELKKRNLY